MKHITSVAASAWNWSNGKKTAIGLVMTAVGVALFWTPAAPAAKEIVSAGVTLTLVGLTHKCAKKEANDGKRN